MAGPLDLTWYNTLVDDSGSGTTGTVWNKSQVSSFMGVINSSLSPCASGPASATAGDVATLDATGKVLADSGKLATNLAMVNVANTFTQPQTLSQTSPAVLLTDSSQGLNLKNFEIVNATQKFYIQAVNDAVSSVIANPLTLDRAGNATIGTDIYEKGRATALGTWIDVPFSAANYTASSGTWTVTAGQQGYYAYTLVGKTAILTLEINASTGLSVGTNNAYVTLPAGLVVARDTYCGCSLTIAGTTTGGLIAAYVGQPKLYINRLDAASMAAGALTVYATIAMSV